MFRVNTSKSTGAKSAISHTTSKLEQVAENTFNWALDTSKGIITNYQYNKESKVLIVCGPTATGKTKFGIEVAKKFGGEIISADSRQVYTGKNLVHGKDLPANLKPQASSLKWRGRQLKYYEIDGVKTWLYDVVEQNEPFSIALWHECAQIVIEDILSRQKLPIVVGGTGLYIKSLTQNLSQIAVPHDQKLRQNMANKNADFLFNYLNRINPDRASKLNESDRQNPRRLVRAIEIAKSKKVSPFEAKRTNLDMLQIGLTAHRDELYRRIDQRVEERIAAGAAGEDSILSAQPHRWKQLEHHIAQQQLTWFKKQPGVTWFDITLPGWKPTAERLIKSWYNQSYAAKD